MKDEILNNLARTVESEEEHLSLLIKYYDEELMTIKDIENRKILNIKFNANALYNLAKYIKEKELFPSVESRSIYKKILTVSKELGCIRAVWSLAISQIKDDSTERNGLENACLMLDEIIKDDRYGSFKTFYYKGLAYYKLEKWTEAINNFLMVRKINERNKNPYFEKANKYIAEIRSKNLEIITEKFDIAWDLDIAKPFNGFYFGMPPTDDLITSYASHRLEREGLTQIQNCTAEYHHTVTRKRYTFVELYAEMLTARILRDNSIKIIRGKSGMRLVDPVNRERIEVGDRVRIASKKPIAEKFYHTITRYTSNGKLEKARALIRQQKEATRGFICDYAYKQNDKEVVKLCLEYMGNKEIPLRNLSAVEMRVIESDETFDKDKFPTFNTLLHKAAKFGYARLVKRLVNDYKLDITNYLSQCPLHLAAREGHEDVVRLLVEAEVHHQPMTLDLQDKKGKTPLMYSCQGGFLHITRYLLAKGSKLDIKDSQGFTALEYALAFSNNPELIKLLIQNGAKYNINAFAGWDTLNYFYWVFTGTDWVGVNKLKEILTLLSAISPRDCNKMKSVSSIFDCIIARDLDGVKRCIMSMPSDINSFNSGGETPLSLAVEQGEIGIISTLSESGADINLENSYGMTPLSKVIELYDNEIFDYLLEHPKLNIKKANNISGENYLHIAVRARNDYAIRGLLEREADLKFPPTIMGDCIFDYSFGSNYEELTDHFLRDDLLKLHIKDNYLQSYQDITSKIILNVGSILKHGVISKIKAKELGVRQKVSSDGYSMRDYYKTMIYVNRVKNKEQFADVFSAEDRGAYGVACEKPCNEEIFTIKLINSSENTPHELYRRLNNSFLVVTSVRSLTKNKPLSDGRLLEEHIQHEIISQDIDLLLLPNRFFLYKNEIVKQSANLNIKFLDEIKEEKLTPTRGVIYVAFVGYKKVKFEYQNSRGQSASCESFAPDYNSPYLGQYFDKVGGDIILHVVRGETNQLLKMPAICQKNEDPELMEREGSPSSSSGNTNTARNETIEDGYARIMSKNFLFSKDDALQPSAEGNGFIEEDLEWVEKFKKLCS